MRGGPLSFCKTSHLQIRWIYDRLERGFCDGGGARLCTSARGDSPSPRPFFRRVRGDLYIKGLFLVAMASETTISLTHPVVTWSRDIAYWINTFEANMRSLVSVSQFRSFPIERLNNAKPLFVNRALSAPIVHEYTILIFRRYYWESRSSLFRACPAERFMEIRGRSDHRQKANEASVITPEATHPVDRLTIRLSIRV